MRRLLRMAAALYYFDHVAEAIELDRSYATTKNRFLIEAENASGIVLASGIVE